MFSLPHETPEGRESFLPNDALGSLERTPKLPPVQTVDTRWERARVKTVPACFPIKGLRLFLSAQRFLGNHATFCFMQRWFCKEFWDCIKECHKTENFSVDRHSKKNFDRILTEFWLHSIFTEVWLNFSWILIEFWLNFGWILAEFRLNFDLISAELWLNFGLSILYYILGVHCLKKCKLRLFASTSMNLRFLLSFCILICTIYAFEFKGVTTNDKLD